MRINQDILNILKKYFLCSNILIFAITKIVIIYRKITQNIDMLTIKWINGKLRQKEQ